MNSLMWYLHNTIEEKKNNPQGVHTANKRVLTKRPGSFKANKKGERVHFAAGVSAPANISV